MKGFLRVFIFFIMVTGKIGFAQAALFLDLSSEKSHIYNSEANLTWDIGSPPDFTRDDVYTSLIHERLASGWRLPWSTDYEQLISALTDYHSENGFLQNFAEEMLHQFNHNNDWNYWIYGEHLSDQTTPSNILLYSHYLGVGNIITDIDSTRIGNTWYVKEGYTGGVTPAPEPLTILLFLTGGAGLAAYRRLVS